MQANVAVVVPVHNGLSYTRRCLECLRTQVDAEFEVVVVDDGSTDGTASHLRDAYPAVRLVAGDGHLWWSGAINTGVQYALARGAEIIVLFNNDNVDASPRLVSRLVELVCDTGACVSAVSARDEGGVLRIVHAGGYLEWPAGRQRLADEGEPLVVEGRVERRDWLPATALAMDRETFLALGGADAARFPQYRGDIDLTIRARKLGRECLVTYDVWAVNDQAQTGMTFERRLGFAEIVRGLWTLRSSYNVREAVPFAFRHCPRRTLVRYLLFYYARYFYACVKSMRRPRKGEPDDPPREGAPVTT